VFQGVIAWWRLGKGALSWNLGKLLESFKWIDYGAPSGLTHRDTDSEIELVSP
jgi:hypothetical protein